MRKSGISSGVILSALLVCLPAIAAGGPQNRSNPSPATFNKDIVPILSQRCVSCHRPGGVGGFSLLTYAEVRPRAAVLRDVTTRRIMPPWKSVDPRGTFVGDRTLDAGEIELIQKWVDAGAVEGRAEDRPKPTPGAAAGERWELGTPDVILRMPQAYELPAGTTDSFRTFVLPIDIPSPRLVRAVEFHPGNARVVHHANLGVDRTEASRRRDEREPGPGYGGGMIPEAAYPPGQMLGWTPGTRPQAAPDGTAWPIEPGSYFSVQLHMQPAADIPELVQASVGLYFTNQPPSRNPIVLRLGSQTLAIPAGVADYVVSDRYVMPVDVDVVAVQGHAHNLARRIEARAVTPDGKERSLLTIADWDFRWQDVYRYASPFTLPKGSVVTIRIVYDNSTANRRNPNNPPRPVMWGQKTSDEMGDVWLQVIPVRNGDAVMLSDDIGRKMQLDDEIAFAKLVERNPADAQAREALALINLRAGRLADATYQFRELVKLTPGSALAHYNLGNALSAQSDLAGAADEFRQALTIDPNIGEAHTNLGVMLSMQGRNDEAMTHFRDAVRLSPSSAQAHANFARMLGLQRNQKEAAIEYARAIALKPDLVSALTGLAWIRAASADETLRNAKEAEELAGLSVTLTRRRDVAALDALAAACASGGRFEQALAAARAALELATSAGMRSTAAEISQRLALYERRLPYRDAP